MNREQQLIDLLYKEVVPAEGCTEPVALAYCAAKTRDVLGHIPDRIDVFASGNMIKNVKSVTVPNSGGMIGIEASVAMGTIAGNAAKELMVISGVTKADLPKVQEYLQKDCIKVFNASKPIKLYIRIEAYYKQDKVIVEFKYTHTNITLIKKNDEIIYEVDDADNKSNLVDEIISKFSIKEIYKIASHLDTSKISDMLDKIVKDNSNISNEGLVHQYGIQTGRNIRSGIDNGFYGDDIRNRAAAAASAGSDARMGGSALPVMTAAGSGNIGLTLSLPLIEFAKSKGKSQEELYRALFFAIVSTVYIKSSIGRLSALCGPTCASAGIAGGLAMMLNLSEDKVEKSIINALAGIIGIMCDGANSSCSIKIANSVYAAFDAVNAAMLGNTVTPHDGIVGDDVEGTIKNIAILATGKGMNETDDAILGVMTGRLAEVCK
ncbi:L-cysteine desulfidase family protein [Francisella philomiragia]|uniref:L-cysteine desulfidase family protein n=1 Tax=Francisella philomiragia TaxID=28110 RepID=UPI0019035C17|nr:L-serine ammonia-lyase, iron-sulfur-dependent, subunit alpha [Francisella philomiragia]MBK2093159.1 serine dehydratase subunit alpha family protein [Francisella philomiragia]MBK2256715.1 serine dehydratase subunit alpha family protein [Francisella philomiragia]MBK2269373.1 serine dehydratase subunit alpha family protein [Francisella philomiragia]MBK2271262.1 serine dehydratase subunit alpha family protein [Francisella philomiragia]MBK2275042.1 serine dehydratase subunit alpha family protein